MTSMLPTTALGTSDHTRIRLFLCTLCRPKLHSFLGRTPAHWVQDGWIHAGSGNPDYPVHGLITVIPVRHINLSYQREAVCCLNTTERSRDSYSSMNDRALGHTFTYCAQSTSLLEMNVQSSELISVVFTGFHVSLRIDQCGVYWIPRVIEHWSVRCLLDSTCHCALISVVLLDSTCHWALISAVFTGFHMSLRILH